MERVTLNVIRRLPSPFTFLIAVFKAVIQFRFKMHCADIY